MPLVACAQMTSTEDVRQNLAALEELVARAAGYGARLVASPENTPFLGDPLRKIAAAEPADGPVARRLAAIAAAHRTWLLVGSMAEAHDGTHAWNSSLLFDDQGVLRALYRKLHLFDIDLPGGPRFVESANTVAGDRAVVVDTPVGRLGMSVCYDLRFGELYRRLVDAGATILAVPSAFTVPTGRDHWHVLLRARAIEAQSWVLAPAQEGVHGNNRVSYGHSLIVDPWGTVVAECADGMGLAIAEIDPDRVARLRAAMPVARHRREDIGPAVVASGHQA